MFGEVGQDQKVGVGDTRRRVSKHDLVLCRLRDMSIETQQTRHISIVMENHARLDDGTFQSLSIVERVVALLLSGVA